MASKQTKDYTRAATEADNPAEKIMKKLEEAKSARVTVIMTQDQMDDLNHYVSYLNIKGEKIQNKKATASQVATIAISEYLAKHREEIEKIKAL